MVPLAQMLQNHPLLYSKYSASVNVTEDSILLLNLTPSSAQMKLMSLTPCGQSRLQGSFCILRKQQETR